jgi:hypothetical protein
MNRPTPKDQVPPFALTTPSLTNSSTSVKSGSRPASRLIVLVPDDLAYGDTTRRIWELAVATDRHIQLLSLCKDIVEESSLRRQLILMSALLGDMRIATEVKVEVGVNWVVAVKRNYRAGDIIVCFAEHRSGLFLKPLNQILEASLDAPVYILPSLYTQEYSSSNWVSQVILWMGWIGIIAGFFLLQSRIAFSSNDWTQTTLLILAVIFEFWLILLWPSLFN